MRLEGRIWKNGRFWLVEVPLLDVMTQGHSRKQALHMIADAIHELVASKDFSVEVTDCGSSVIEVGSTDAAALTALLLRRQRAAHGLTLEQVARRLGQSSRNAYARYEQGLAVPTIAKLTQLLRAIDPEDELVLKRSAA